MKMDIFLNIRNSFWNTKFWLPPNVTWKDVQSDDWLAYTSEKHLYLALPLSLCLLLFRFFLQRFVFAPFGLSLGIKHIRSRRAASNDVLEAAYKTFKSLKHEEIALLAKKLDWRPRQVEHWIRLRRLQDKPSTLTKFSETCWKCFYYIFSFAYGIVCLWDKPWLWDTRHCWYGYPHQGITFDCWIYYMFSMAFYWSLVLSHAFDIRRRDFWQMFVHHIAAVILLSLSWVCNFHRIGTLVLLVHDCADIFVEGAKSAQYANYQKLCDVLFSVTAILWIITRLVIYPFWIIKSTSIDAPNILPMFPVYYVFNSLLLILLALHCFWTYIIIRVAYKLVTIGKVDDVRSSTSSSELETNEQILVAKSKEQAVETYSTNSANHCDT